MLACFVPFIALAAWHSKPDGWHGIGLALGIWFMNFSCLVLLRRLPIFSSLEWNWSGKVFAIIASLAFIALWRAISWREIGFTGLRKGSWLPFIALILFQQLVPPWPAIGSEPIKTETLLFQLTMPGIDEEVIYRGILLVLFNRAFGNPWNLLGAKIGWGCILISVLFGLIHGVGFNEQFQFHVDVTRIISLSFSGFLIGWVRERTGSLYPAIVFHNIGNSASLVVDALFNGVA